MKAILLACGIVTFAATAVAAQDIELDRYPRHDPAVGRPMFYYQNPNFTHISGSNNNNACYLVPGRFNVAKGDAVLSAEPGSVIQKLLVHLGQVHSHSGMPLSSTSMRYNTMAPERVDTIDSGVIPQYLKPTGSWSLRDGHPGMITQTAEASTIYNEINLLDGLVLYSYSTGASRSTQRSRAASMFSAFNGWYSLYAYTNMSWADPFTKTNGDGNMCSGSIAHAHRLAGNPGWAGMERFYEASVRDGAAELMYAEVYDLAIDEPDLIGDVGFAINDLLGGTSLSDFARRVANQFVNCMAFDDCANRSSRWRDGVGAGSSLSPDDLYALAYLWMVASWSNGIDFGFVYDGAKPLEVTGEYYCCNSGVRAPYTIACSFQDTP